MVKGFLSFFFVPDYFFAFFFAVCLILDTIVWNLSAYYLMGYSVSKEQNGFSRLDEIYLTNYSGYYCITSSYLTMFF